jgi:hypothetical protein
MRLSSGAVGPEEKTRLRARLCRGRVAVVGPKEWRDMYHRAPNNLVFWRVNIAKYMTLVAVRIFTSHPPFFPS